MTGLKRLEVCGRGSVACPDGGLTPTGLVKVSSPGGVDGSGAGVGIGWCCR